MPLRVVTVTGDVEHEASIATALGLRPDVELVMRCVDRIELIATIRGADLDAIVVAGSPLWFDAMVAQEARDRRIRVVAVTGDPLAVERMSMLGALVLEPGCSVDDVVTGCGPEPGDEVPLEPAGTPEVAAAGRVTAVWGPKGSPGRSTLALELAWQMSSSHEAVVVDADPYGGDLLQMSGVLEELPTVVWAAALGAGGSLSPGSLDELRRVTERGPALLPGLSRPEQWMDVSDYGWEAALSELRRRFERVVCDVGFCLEPPEAGLGGAPRGRNEMTRITLRHAHQVVAVCRGDPVGVKSFVWAFSSLTSLVERDRIVVAVNRVKPADIEDIESVLKRHLGLRPAVFIPDEAREVERARRGGRLVGECSPGCELAEAAANLAAALGGSPAPRGFLARLAGRR